MFPVHTQRHAPPPLSTLLGSLSQATTFRISCPSVLEICMTRHIVWSTTKFPHHQSDLFGSFIADSWWPGPFIENRHTPVIYTASSCCLAGWVVDQSSQILGCGSPSRADKHGHQSCSSSLCPLCAATITKFQVNHQMAVCVGRSSARRTSLFVGECVDGEDHIMAFSLTLCAEYLSLHVYTADCEAFSGLHCSS